MAKVFRFIESMDDNEGMPFLHLARKLATILMLLTGKRTNSIDSFDVNQMDLTANSGTFIPRHLLKHNRPSMPIKPITYTSFPENTRICPVDTIAHYYVRRSEFETNATKLFITSTPPHEAAHKDTIANWVKWVLSEAGIDTNIYKTHSCRAAATSKADKLGLPLQTILSSGDWSNERTFYKHYKRDIDVAFPKEGCIDFGSIMLNKIYHV